MNCAVRDFVMKPDDLFDAITDFLVCVLVDAIACWLTCGEVRRIEVYENEGGVTTFVGGCRCLIIPAGYVGCGFCAMIFVILSGGRMTAAVACAAFTLSLIIALFYSPNKVLVYLCLAYALLNIAVLCVEFWAYSPILQFLIFQFE